MAKVFTTNGTGAQQTLDEASSNRIKVYDDFEDIDTTDLVDGEIVSTKEDVAGGNVYDYFKDYVEDYVDDHVKDYIEEQIADAQSYSTEETLTGGTWIDGKPIYKITKEGTANFSNDNWTDITLFNDNVQKKVVKLDMICETVCLRPEYLTITNKITFSTVTGSGNGRAVSNGKYVLTVFYTKATD